MVLLRQHMELRVDTVANTTEPRVHAAGVNIDSGPPCVGAAGRRAVCHPSSVTNNKRKLVARVSRDRGGSTGMRRRASEHLPSASGAKSSRVLQYTERGSHASSM